MRRLLVLGASAVLVAVLGSVALLQSDWLRNRVRAKMASVLEDATGGRAEIGAFDYDWRTLTANVRGFVLHGTEAPGAPVFLRAERIQLGLRVVSLLKRDVDLAFLTVDKPEIHVTAAPDGTTNIPAPKVHGSSKDFVQQLLDLKLRRFTMSRGFVDYNSQRIPLELKAEDVRAAFRYESQAYRGEFSSRALRLDMREISGAVLAVNAQFSLDASALQITSARVGMGDSEAHLSGTVRDFAAPQGAFQVNAHLKPRDVNRPFHLPIADEGDTSFQGLLSFHTAPAFDWSLHGKTKGTGLGFRNKSVNIAGASIATDLQLTQSRLDLKDLVITALGGSFRGRLDLVDGSKFHLVGEAHGVPLQQFTALRGTASGPLESTGFISGQEIRETQAHGKFDLKPDESGVPVSGTVELSYLQAANQISFANTNLNLGSTHVEGSGTLGKTLEIRADTSNLDELLAALPAAGPAIPKDLGIVFKGGAAHFNGTVSGPLQNPAVSGKIEATKLSVRGQDLDTLSADFDLTRERFLARSLSLSQGPFHLQGSGRAGLFNWQIKDASPVSASLNLRGAEIHKLLEARGGKAEVSGILAATAEVKGTFGSPQASAGLDAENVTFFDEHLTRVRASVLASDTRLQVIQGRVNSLAGQLEGTGEYTHAREDWTTGQLRFEATAHGLAVAEIQTIQNYRKGAGGQLDLNAKGTARLNKGEFRIETVTSETKLSNASLDGHKYGNITVTAQNRGPILDLRASANVLNTPLQGSGEWRLEGDDPGHGQIVIPRLTLATLHQLVPDPQRKDLPFDGFVEGKIDIDGPLRKPDLLKASVRIDALQINATSGAKLRAGAQARDLVVRNAKPILLTATTKGLEIQSAQFTGTDTTLEARGRIAFDAKNPWDLDVKGSINLAILQLFNANLLGSGVSVLNAAIRGPYTEPQVDGRLELKNASLYLTDLPNGLDQASGVILFDRSRATVESLTAITGGGRVTIQKGSFVGFRGPALLYRVQASADRVRYRSPEGVSITVNALMSMVGTSESSVLSGTVTVVRAGFNPTTDIGGLLASTARPVSAPSIPNEYLKGIQFDVRVESAQSLEIQTSLTRNIDAEANLRIRGTPDRPIVLGNLTVNEGEIEFFGNRYTINRGEVNFYNAVKIEPIIDMDLETVVRGITVDITFSGTLSKLNFSYRSDPPLQTNDIIALLAVGRTPVTTGSLASSQTGSTSNYLSTGTNALLSQAVTAPVTGRLQRFFGVSHIKIDPQLTDITSVPQARLTLEQQISKDITLTYITNLTRTQEQIIRVEWDFNRRWSVIALRDENGAFGIDVQYRKRFK